MKGHFHGLVMARDVELEVINARMIAHATGHRLRGRLIKFMDYSWHLNALLLSGLDLTMHQVILSDK